MADGGELARQRGVHGFTLLCFMCAFLARCSGRLCLDEHQSAWLLHRLGWRMLSLGMGLSVVQIRRLSDGSKAWRFMGTSGVATKSWQVRHVTHAPLFSLARRIMYVCSLLRLQQRQRLIVAKIVFTTTNTSSNAQLRELPTVTCQSGGIVPSRALSVLFPKNVV